MEIPYIVTPRKDTGLFNSKIAIWLFLASEVMLFGGFFSAYVYLRLGAEHDYPWPERSLPVLPGLINTFVLIFSSVTVVFAWASLKLRKWRSFQLFMSITVACSLIFLALKGVEYYVKFNHQALRLMDYTVVEGHLGKLEQEDAPVGADGKKPLEHDRHGKEIEENQINFETKEISFDVLRAHREWVDDMLAEAKEKNAAITLAKTVVMGVHDDYKDEHGAMHPGATTWAKMIDDGQLPELPKEAIVIKKNEALSDALLSRFENLHKKARGHNADVRIDNLRDQWKLAKEVNKGREEREYQDKVAVDETAVAPKSLVEVPAVTFNVSPEVEFRFAPRDIKEGPDSGTLRDGTVVKGKLLESDMVFHYVDAIDFRHTVMKAKEKGIDPNVAIHNSWLLKNNPEMAEIWEKHERAVAQLEEVFAKEGKGREPTLKDRYRINWEEMAYYGQTKNLDDVKIVPSEFAAPVVTKGMKEQFMGPNYDARHFAHLVVPREQVQFSSKFSPAWNTFYAIYFTMTGLHGLHVIGGAIVLGYYLFFGRKMYLTNPEWLANRVEIGGLFWHFVDLVWIFLFPILYLM